MQLTVSGLLNQFQRIMQGVLFATLEEQLAACGKSNSFEKMTSYA
jgi:hypothetical protein